MTGNSILELQRDYDFGTMFKNECSIKVIRLFLEGKLTRDQARSWLDRVRKYAVKWWHDWSKIGLDMM